VEAATFRVLVVLGEGSDQLRPALALFTAAFGHRRLRSCAGGTKSTFAALELHLGRQLGPNLFSLHPSHRTIEYLCGGPTACLQVVLRDLHNSPEDSPVF